MWSGFLTEAYMSAAVCLPKSEYALNYGLDLNMRPNLYDKVNSCVVTELKPLSLHFKVQVTLTGWNCNAPVVAMMDCGATILFISKRFVKDQRFARTH